VQRLCKVVLLIAFWLAVSTIHGNAQTPPAVVRLEESAWVNWLRTLLPRQVEQAPNGNERYWLVDAIYCGTTNDREARLLSAAVPMEVPRKASVPLLLPQHCNDQSDLAKRLILEFPGISSARAYEIAVKIDNQQISFATSEYYDLISGGRMSIAPIDLGRVGLALLPIIVGQNSFALSVAAQFVQSAIIAQLTLGAVQPQQWTDIERNYLIHVPSTAAPRSAYILFPIEFLNYLVDYLFAGRDIFSAELIPNIGEVTLTKLKFASTASGLSVFTTFRTEKLGEFEITADLGLQVGELFTSAFTVLAPPLDCGSARVGRMSATNCEETNKQRDTLKLWVQTFLDTQAKGGEVRYIIRPTPISVPTPGAKLAKLSYLINSVPLLNQTLIGFDVFVRFE